MPGPGATDGKGGQLTTDATEAALGIGIPDTDSDVELFSRGGSLYNSAGLTDTVNLVVWRAPFACTVTAVKGFRVDGTGATVNARRNGVSSHLAGDLSLTSMGTWMDGGAVQDTIYTTGDELEIMVKSLAGSPTQVAIQVDFTRS